MIKGYVCHDHRPCRKHHGIAAPDCQIDGCHDQANTGQQQIVPDREAMGGDRWTGSLLATPAPIMARPLWDRLPQSVAHLPPAAQGLQQVETRHRNAKGLKIDGKAEPTGETPAISSALGARVGAIWLGNVPPHPKLYTSPGGTVGMQPNPMPAPAATANSRPVFPPWPWTKTNNYESSPKDGMARSCPSPFP